MIFGKTNLQKFEEEQSRLSWLQTHRIKKFAIIPTKIYNGRYVWLGWVWADYIVCIYTDGIHYTRLYPTQIRYFLEDKQATTQS